MVINGVSPSTGIERPVGVAAAAGGLRLLIRDRKLGIELGRATVPPEDLMSVLAEQPTGARTLASTAGGAALGVEVRRNEVWLAVGGPDAAVGRDDLMDAVAGAAPFEVRPWRSARSSTPTRSPRCGWSRPSA